MMGQTGRTQFSFTITLSFSLQDMLEFGFVPYRVANGPRFEGFCVYQMADGKQK